MIPSFELEFRSRAKIILISIFGIFLHHSNFYLIIENVCYVSDNILANMLVEMLAKMLAEMLRAAQIDPISANISANIADNMLAHFARARKLF